MEGRVQPAAGGRRLTRARFLAGIDLGTSHSALALVDLAREGDPAASLEVVPIPQLVAPGEVQERALLPSNAYLPGEHELPAGARRLPWGEPPAVVGELARAQGARVPGRLVASAKSWLSHPRVDRTAPLLPWGAPEEVPRLSPVDASALYLAHLAAAFRHRTGAPLGEQDVVLTVPASFDEVARELTVRAAREAGLERVTLVEEPTAAFYDLVARCRSRGDDLAAALAGARLVLVADVGGGTTDFTLIHVDAREDAAPRLARIAVGDHLLLGGDNVDLALARAVEGRLAARLDAVQWAMLVQACRMAKERLLAEGAPERLTVAVPGRGSRLVGGTLSAELSRDEVRATLLDGFFPRVGPGERPRRAARAGLLELGLPYEADPAVTRHLAAFLADHAGAVAEATGAAVAGLPRPDAILLNGGVFTPPAVRARLAEVVASWFPGEPPPRLLDAARLDVAVARGAAYHALVRRGLGLRIGGGTPRAYYVGVEAEGSRALCVIPRHLEEGREVEVPRTFALRLDRPVRFAIYATTRARFEAPGDAVDVDETLQPLPPIETVLRSEAGRPGEVPVRLHAALTEIGTLALWCVATDRDARWKLEFQLRGDAEDRAPSEVAAMPRRFDEARALVERYYGKKGGDVDPRRVKDLSRDLERILGPREGWPTPVVRELWGALHAGQARRRRSADHERLWLSLTGWCLRPGFGAPLDGWRAAETFRAFAEGLQFQAEPHNWQAWWVLWRRIAGGLDAGAQGRILAAIAPFLAPADPKRPKPKVAGVKPEAVDELVRLAASLERVAPARKREAGEAIFARVEREGPAPHLLWALGRLGARVPFSAVGAAPVAPELAEAWIRRLLALEKAPPRDLAFALAQLARASGDRARDVDPAVRDEVLAALAAARAGDELARTVREPTALAAAEEQRVFGDSLPAGLRLVG